MQNSLFLPSLQKILRKKRMKERIFKGPVWPLSQHRVHQYCLCITWVSVGLCSSRYLHQVAFCAQPLSYRLLSKCPVALVGLPLALL